jgi:hypothetical protein
VAGASFPGLRKARDTVIGDKPAALAMVRTLWGASAERLRFFFAAMLVDSRWNLHGLRTTLQPTARHERDPATGSNRSVDAVDTANGMVGLGATFYLPGAWNPLLTR